MTTETETPRIMPGDVVQLDGEYCGVKRGDRAVVDTHYFDPDGDGEVMICFRASAYRDPNKRSLGLVEAIELTMTNKPPIPWPVVSCSGGPLPFVKVTDLQYVGTTEQTFWRFKDGFARAHNGENYVETVNLWSWEGK